MFIRNKKGNVCNINIYKSKINYILGLHYFAKI